MNLFERLHKEALRRNRPALSPDDGNQGPWMEVHECGRQFGKFLEPSAPIGWEDDSKPWAPEPLWIPSSPEEFGYSASEPMCKDGSRYPLDRLPASTEVKVQESMDALRQRALRLGKPYKIGDQVTLDGSSATVLHVDGLPDGEQWVTVALCFPHAEPQPEPVRKPWYYAEVQPWQRLLLRVAVLAFAAWVAWRWYL